ncbi:BTB/POZ domain-containing protein 9 [Balamuthia mandrillaris]
MLKVLYTLRRFMDTRGAKLLGQHHAQVEQQWLSLSPEAVSQVLKSKLDGVSELQVFEAVHRWYLHQAQQEGFERGCLKKVLGRIKLPLISGLELAEVVEPTGLFSEAQMKEAYKEAATKYRMVQQDPFAHTDKFYFYPQQHDLLRWLISLKTRGPKLALRFATGTEDIRPSAGPPVHVAVYRYRTRVFSAQYAPDDAFVSEGVKEKFKCVSDGLFSVLVHMPRTLFTTIED